MHRRQQLKVANGVAVKTDIALLLDARDVGDMLDVAVERHVQVVQHSPRGHDAVFQMLDAETRKILCLELLHQLLAGKRLGEHPVVELKRTQLGAENTFELFA